MTMIDEYIASQLGAVKRMYMEPRTYLVAVPDKSTLLMPERHTVRLSPLERFSPQNVFIRETDEPDGAYEIWVRTDFSNYRKAFKRFLKTYYSVEDIPQGYHVDHSLARCIARKNRLQYIRLFLVPAIINIRHGAFVEKKMELWIENRNAYYCSMYMYMKLLGIRIPESVDELQKYFYNIVDEFVREFSATKMDVIMSLVGELRLWKDIYYNNQESNKTQIDFAIKCFLRRITWENGVSIDIL